ncbi:archaemetzincin-2-like [Littorina saxatilis]|uniref:Archaemetzincin-2 n=1 Tax=Littorina saxatilis TaxID=31220 RepID=A0AAN9C366_9CAEN
MPKYAKTKDSSNSGSTSTSSKRIRYVPFARGFKPRDENARLLALGFKKAANIPKEFSCGSAVTLKPGSGTASVSGTSRSTPGVSSPSSPASVFFQPVPQPTSGDDWLAQYDEDGQTYKQFLEENPWMSGRKVKYIKQTFCSKGTTLGERYPDGKICILQLGKFDNKSIDLPDVIDYTRRFLCLPVEELPPLDLEVTEGKVVVVDDPVTRLSTGRSTRIKRTELHSRYNAKTGHIQLRVDSVLSKLRTLIPQQALCLIALTTLDLYGDASDLFVAGMAAGLERVAVFSLQRYDPTITFSKEHWYDLQSVPRPVSAPERSRLMIHRSCKLVVHEILHLLGVDHCVFFDCCMNGSGHLAEDFRQPMHLCPVDLRKLHTLVGFEVQDRYKSLLEFYSKQGLKGEAEWVQKRLKYLSGS